MRCHAMRLRCPMPVCVDPPGSNAAPPYPPQPPTPLQPCAHGASEPPRPARGARAPARRPRRVRRRVAPGAAAHWIARTRRKPRVRATAFAPPPWALRLPPPAPRPPGPHAPRPAPRAPRWRPNALSPLHRLRYAPLLPVASLCPGPAAGCRAGRGRGGRARAGSSRAAQQRAYARGAPAGAPPIMAPRPATPHAQPGRLLERFHTTTPPNPNLASLPSKPPRPAPSGRAPRARPSPGTGARQAPSGPS
jgi:hypothetical protein